jgi:hypothetical protein
MLLCRRLGKDIYNTPPYYCRSEPEKCNALHAVVLVGVGGNGFSTPMESTSVTIR